MVAIRRLRNGVLAPIGTTTTCDRHQMLLGAMLTAESREPPHDDFDVDLVLGDTENASDESSGRGRLDDSERGVGRRK